MDAKTAPMWKKLPNETAKSYKAFTIYRGLPLGKLSDPKNSRTLFNVTIKLGLAPRKEKSPASTIETWAAKYHWKERAEAYDAHMENISLTVVERGLEDYQKEVIERGTLQVIALQEIIEKTLSGMMAGLAKEILPTPMNIQRIAKAVETVDDLARRMAQLPTSYKSEEVEEKELEGQIYLVGGENEQDSSS